MPTSRPAAGTAILNTGNTLVGTSNTKGFWLVDANINPPDLSANANPAMVRAESSAAAAVIKLAGQH